MTPTEFNAMTPFERELIEELRKLRMTLEEIKRVVDV